MRDQHQQNLERKKRALIVITNSKIGKRELRKERKGVDHHC